MADECRLAVIPLTHEAKLLYIYIRLIKWSVKLNRVIYCYRRYYVVAIHEFMRV